MWPWGDGFMCRRSKAAYSLAAAAALVLIGALSGNASDLPAPPPPYDAKAPVVVKAPEPASHFYIGAGMGGVHHTGYLPPWSLAGEPPANNGFNVQQYILGGKVYGGFEIYDWLRLEGAFHYLGAAHFPSDFFLPGGGTALSINTEKSYALAGSVVFVSPPLSSWSIPTFVPTYLLARVGVAGKDITQTGLAGSWEERTLAGVLGAGFEFRLSPNWFARLEYEYLSTAIGGPRVTVPEFRGLFNLAIGGTQNVVNVMHTPLSVGVGYRF
jgi:opacity protein-like surface antigen